MITIRSIQWKNKGREREEKTKTGRKKGKQLINTKRKTQKKVGINLKIKKDRKWKKMTKRVRKELRRIKNKSMVPKQKK